VDDDILDALMMSEQPIFYLVADLMALKHSHRWRHPNMDLNEQADSALSDPAFLGAFHARSGCRDGVD
jgi:hypothetical protein